MFNILIDTGFWIALYDSSRMSQFYSDAERISKEIIDQQIIIPYPTLYEFVNSRFSRKESVIEFQKILTRPNVIRLSDSEYKEIALEEFFIKHKYAYSDLSLVDEIIKLILKDRNLRIDYIVSYDSALKNEAMSIGIRLV